MTVISTISDPDASCTVGLCDCCTDEAYIAPGAFIADEEVLLCEQCQQDVERVTVELPAREAELALDAILGSGLIGECPEMWDLALQLATGLHMDTREIRTIAH